DAPDDSGDGIGSGDGTGSGDGPVIPPVELPSGEPTPPPAAEEPATEEPARDAAQEPATDAGVPVREEAAAPVQAVLEVREPSSHSVRLTWSSAGRGTRYEVTVDGVPIATTVATRARLIGLRPDTKYVVTLRNAKAKYLAKGTAETLPAARPAQNTWFVLENALTGGAADLYAARSASGTAITLAGSDGDAQQQWKLVPAGGGAFSLRSRATGKCAVPLDGNTVAGTPLVQGECVGGDANTWILRLSGYGFTLRSTDGDLVVGVGAQRFGAHRLLVLQNPDGSRHQSWTAVPG
ncbi:RICIN domain-containing protein, partial [Actinoplanes sp. NPDC051633]|uniref:RICIN domain-containing protein n=1 Tax=Actinoplanes sp. NPDC051633 TaxID=3155670 RepID=UPI00344848C1